MVVCACFQEVLEGGEGQIFLEAVSSITGMAGYLWTIQDISKGGDFYANCHQEFPSSPENLKNVTRMEMPAQLSQSMLTPSPCPSSANWNCRPNSKQCDSHS